MKASHCLGVGVSTGALAGFIIAWQVKPIVVTLSSDPAMPLQTKVERHLSSSHPPGRFALSEFSQRWQEANEDEEGEQKQAVLLAGLDSAEFPGLLAEMSDIAGLSGLDNPGHNQLRQLVKAWHAKAPEAAMAWLRTLPKALDRQGLLCAIVDEVAETNLDGAVSLMRQYGIDDEGRIFIPDKLLEKAAANGEDKLLEICKLGLNRGGNWPWSCQVSYPEGFDFRRVLDGLAATQGEIGDQGRFANVPSNLVSEWAKRDFKGAWAWLQEGKTVIYNGSSDLIESVPPADAGALLAAVFDPAAPEDQRYDEVDRILYRMPSAEMLEAFLQAAPGDRSAHLNGLFDGLTGGNLGELQALLLERMGPEQRAQALQRSYENGVDSQTRSALVRLLQGLGHGEEEIQALLPEKKE